DDSDPRGALEIATTGPLEVQLSCLTEVGLSNRPEYLAVRDSEVADDLLVWEDETRSAFLERLQRLLDHDGAVNPNVCAIAHAHVSDEWVLYVRRRDA